MITEIPTKDDFQNSANDFLNLAWDIVTNLLLDWEDAKDQEILCEKIEEQEKTDELSAKQTKYFNKAQRSLSVAFSLIHQATEFFLKAGITEVSPFLLITGDYPKKPSDEHVSFCEFKTVDSQDLIRVYNLVSSHELPESFKSNFESLRKIRNSIIHTINPNLRIEIQDLIKKTLQIYTQFNPSCSWIKFRQKYIDDDLYSLLYGEVHESHGDYDYGQKKLIEEIGCVSKYLTSSEREMYFQLPTKGRFYHCPSCYKESFFGANLGCHQMPKLAFLKPNTPTSTSLYCIVCENSVPVRRDGCYRGKTLCKGNVISLISDDDYCLACGYRQESSESESGR